MENNREYNIKNGDISKVSFATNSSYSYVLFIAQGKRKIKSLKSQKINKALLIITKANNELDKL